MWRKVCFLLALTISMAPFCSGLAPTVSALSSTRKVCSTIIAAHAARCFATVVTDAGGTSPLSSSSPQGYGPADFRAAYGAHGNVTTHVGIVTAYDSPHIAADLTNYSKVYGLPIPTTCTTSMKASCFEKLSQKGTATLPAVNSSWAIEASMDIEAVHATCPQCQISLIEASSTSMDNFAQAVGEAVIRGAKVVSNSYGGAESSGEAAYDGQFHKSGVAMVASSGDSGYGTGYPAASPNVIAVGGTSLKLSGSRLVSEVAWAGAGSGCSLYEYKPNWQHDKKCSMRSIADIAADADPSTGAAVYDSYGDSGKSGWFTVGGTSLAAPLVAGMLAAAGATNNQPAALYASTAVRDIIAGNNGSCVSYLCRAGAGYDGPTGLGVLNNF